MGPILAMALAMAAPRPGWTDFATCAAAYEANAQVADPSRPASMIGMISDTAKDYRTAAVKLYQTGKRADAAAADKAVGAYIQSHLAKLKPQSREAVEHVIDACPQLPDQG